MQTFYIKTGLPAEKHLSHKLIVKIASPVIRYVSIYIGKNIQTNFINFSARIRLKSIYILYYFLRKKHKIEGKCKNVLYNQSLNEYKVYLSKSKHNPLSYFSYHNRCYILRITV